MTEPIYPELTSSSEPIANVINYLTNRTWHKAAEKSLKDASISTVGDLCKLTELQASTLKGIKPPNNIQTIREAMKKFEKLLTKREKISQANSALKEDESEGGQLTRTSSNSSLASIIETSTPDEEDKMMKEFYERPSPSPTDEIESAASSSGEKESNCEETNVSGASSEPHLPTIAVPTPLRPSTTVQPTIESSSGIVTEPVAPSSSENPGPSFSEKPEVAVPSKTVEETEIEETEETDESEKEAKKSEIPLDEIVSNVHESPDDTVKPEEKTEELQQLNRSEQNEEKDLEERYQEALDLLPHLDSKCLADLISKASVLLAKKL